MCLIFKYKQKLDKALQNERTHVTKRCKTYLSFNYSLIAAFSYGYVHWLINQVDKELLYQSKQEGLETTEVLECNKSDIHFAGLQLLESFTGSWRFYPRSDTSITTPMNWMKSNTGVKNDQTGHKATLKQIAAAIKVAVVTGISAGYCSS